MQCVLVLDKNKLPLMPCQPARARALLRQKRAVAFRAQPFTILLKDRQGGSLQPVELKVDPGSKTSGMVLVGHFQRGMVVLLAFHLIHRGHSIKASLDKRRAARRTRRARKTRYREPRFQNRTRREGWLPPSLESRVGNISTWFHRLRRLCPIQSVSQELVRFDTQALQNPEIEGVEYQRGELYGFEVREYVLCKFGHQCVYCGKREVSLELEHVLPKARGGTNRVSNLVIACKPCNQKKGARTAEEFGYPHVAVWARAPLKDAAAVNTTRWALLSRLKEVGLLVRVGTGGRTKYNRSIQGYPKAHFIDAACVGETGGRVRLSPKAKPLCIEAKGRGSRQMCLVDKHGFPRTRAKQGGVVLGFQTGDLVLAQVPNGKKRGRYLGRVAVRASGYFNISTLKTTVQGISHLHCRRLQHKDGYLFSFSFSLTKEEALSPRPERRGFRAGDR